MISIRSSLLRRCGAICKSKSPIRHMAPLCTLSYSQSRTDNLPKKSTTIQFVRCIHHHKITPVSKVCKDAKTALELSGLKSGDLVAVGKCVVDSSFFSDIYLIRNLMIPCQVDLVLAELQVSFICN